MGLLRAYEKFCIEMTKQKERNGNNPNKWAADIARDFRLNKKDVKVMAAELRTRQVPRKR